MKGVEAVKSSEKVRLPLFTCGEVVGGRGMSHNLAVIGMMDELWDESNENLQDS
jgi:hypothetical protein